MFGDNEGPARCSHWYLRDSFWDSLLVYCASCVDSSEEELNFLAGPVST